MVSILRESLSTSMLHYQNELVRIMEKVNILTSVLQKHFVFKKLEDYGNVNIGYSLEIADKDVQTFLSSHDIDKLQMYRQYELYLR